MAWNDVFLRNFIKKWPKILAVPEKASTFALAKTKPLRLAQGIGVWCNGNTADSGPAFPGSSPGTPTEEQKQITGTGF